MPHAIEAFYMKFVVNAGEVSWMTEVTMEYADLSQSARSDLFLHPPRLLRRCHEPGVSMLDEVGAVRVKFSSPMWLVADVINQQDEVNWVKSTGFLEVISGTK